MLSSLNKAWQKETYTLLQLLAYSDRPLRINEAVDALAVDLTAKDGVLRFDKKARMPDPADMSWFCSSLILLVPTKQRYISKQEAEMRQWSCNWRIHL